MYNRSKLVALVAIAVMITAAPSLAQTVDLRTPAGEVVTYLFGMLATALTALASVAIRLVMVKVGMQNSALEQNLNDRLNDIIFKGMDFAQATAENEILKKGSGLEAVKFDNYFISLAASYVAERAPDILKKFTVTQEKLVEMIWARIPAYAQTVPVMGGASTPATGKAVAAVTGGPSIPARAQPAPVIEQPKTETPLPADKVSASMFDEAPQTGA